MAILIIILSFFINNGTTIEKEKVRNLIEEYIVKMGAYNREHVVFEYNNLPDRIEFQEDDAKMKISDSYLTIFKGNITIPVDFCINEKIIKRKYFNLKVRTYDSIYIAQRYLKQNEVLSMNDINKVWLETTYLNSQEALNSDECIGKRNTKSFNKGQPILLNFIDNLPIIEKGKNVRIMVKVNNVVVYSKGIARQDGKLGDKILVENSISGSVIRALVRDENVVELIR
jgi:flagella basal body P-ring formation protein FlgA